MYETCWRTVTFALMPNRSLQGKTALVCGATQGIGCAAAHALAAAGAKVILCGRNDEGLAQVLAELPKLAEVGSGATLNVARQHEIMLVDHANPSAVEKAADAFVARIGAVHIVVVNTGAPEAGYLIDASTEEIDKCVAQLLSTAHKLAQVTAPGMRAAKYGRIIVVGSTSIERPIRGQGVSNVARAAMANWTRTLAGELGGFAITANLIMPGSTRTQRLESIIAGRAKRSGSSVDEVEASMIGKIPVGRFASPQEIAAVIAFIASPAAAYVNGALIPVDGGMLCMQS